MIDPGDEGHERRQSHEARNRVREMTDGERREQDLDYSGIRHPPTNVDTWVSGVSTRLIAASVLARKRVFLQTPSKTVNPVDNHCILNVPQIAVSTGQHPPPISSCFPRVVAVLARSWPLAFLAGTRFAY